MDGFTILFWIAANTSKNKQIFFIQSSHQEIVDSTDAINKLFQSNPETKNFILLKRNKLKIYRFNIIIFLVLSITGCDREEPNNDRNNQISYAKTILGGCHGQDMSELKSFNNENDTVITSIKNDTLDIFAGMNYICCAPFISEINTIYDSITITITDTCSFPDNSCYCRCMCYYIWNFLFTDFLQKIYNYKIILISPLEGEPKVLKEGKIEIID